VDQDLVIRRRVMEPADLEMIRQLIVAEGAQGRSHLSNRLCETWDWRQANGRYRQIACRDLLRRLEAKGLIQLPPPLKAARRPGYRNVTRQPELWDTVSLTGPLTQFRSRIQVRLVQEVAHARVYAGLIGTYHYLGYQQATGAQLKYLVWYTGRPIACLSFGPAAWKLAARDHYIGWSAPVRPQRLAWVVNNDRFLIAPGIQIPHLASYVLAATLRRLRRRCRSRGCGSIRCGWTSVPSSVRRRRHGMVFGQTAPASARAGNRSTARTQRPTSNPRRGIGSRKRSLVVPVVRRPEAFAKLVQTALQ